MKTLAPFIEYSFGTDNVLPHIVFPLNRAADRMVITPPGEEPPKLGVEMLPETDHKAKMNSTNPFPGYDDQSTYSFSWHSMYLDFMKWRVTNLPAGLLELDLHSFWQDVPMRLVTYELINPEKIHSIDNKRYLFCFSFQHLPNTPLVWPECVPSEEVESESESDTEEADSARSDGNDPLSTTSSK